MIEFEREKFVGEWSVVFDRQIKLAYEQRKINESTYKTLANQICDAHELGQAMQFYADLYSELKQAIREELHTRITKGAEYIESIGESHKHYKAAMQRYEDLCSELAIIDGG